MKRALVIGGTRYFGRLLVNGLIEQGWQTTVLNRGRTPDVFGDRVRRIHADRRVADDFKAALAQAGDFDVVYDQFCYSPLDARISAEALAGRVGSYVLASTIETYAGLPVPSGGTFTEQHIDLASMEVDFAYPWHDPALAAASYARGKRQAEAWFKQDGRLPVLAVRIGHVLSGRDDFTGRLRFYVDCAEKERPMWHAQNAAPSSFISAAGIARFLLWAAQSGLQGSVNAADPRPLTSLDIYKAACALTGKPERSIAVRSDVGATELSPFDFPTPFIMNVERAQSAGYRFDDPRDWLGNCIRDLVDAVRSES